MAYTDEFGNIFGTSEDFDFFGDASGDIFYNTADDPWTAGDVFDWGGANATTFLDLVKRYGRQGVDLLKGAFKKPDGSTDWRAVLTAGGAAAPLIQQLLGGSESRPTGYQGSIPTYTAVREAVPQTYDPNRRPGSGGQRYFTDVQYATAEGLPAAQEAATAQAQGLASLNAANPLNAAPVAYQPPAPPPAATPTAPAYNEAYSGENVLNTVRGLLGTQKMAKGGIVGLQDGGFVVPADVVSHLGNGSSRAGINHLARKGAMPIQGRGDGMSDSNRTTINGRQPAAVADGEAYFPPKQVENMGGADRLYAMMDKIRKDRTGTTKQGKQINPNQYV